MRLCEYNFSVIFSKASDLVIKLAKTQDSQTLSKLHRKLEKVDLLILDELSYLSFSRNQAE
jgi:DNA replication protein DnaC